MSAPTMIPTLTFLEFLTTQGLMIGAQNVASPVYNMPIPVCFSVHLTKSACDPQELNDNMFRLSVDKKSTTYEPIATGDGSNIEELLAFDPGRDSWEKWSALKMVGEEFTILMSHHRSVLESSGYKELLEEVDDTSCMRNKTRFTQVRTLSYAEKLERNEDDSTNNYKDETYDFGTFSKKLKFDLNKCFGCTDVVTPIVIAISAYIRTNIPDCEKLGKQKDRMNLKGLLYMVVRCLRTARRAWQAILYALWRIENVSDCVRHMLGYCLCLYNATMYASGMGLNRHGHTAAHLLVMAEDYPAIAAFEFPHASFWKGAGMTALLPVELAAFNLGSQQHPTRAALLTFIITYIETGLTNMSWEPPSWGEDFRKRIMCVRTMFESVLRNGATCLSPQLRALGRSFYIYNIMEIYLSSDEKASRPTMFDNVAMVEQLSCLYEKYQNGDELTTEMVIREMFQSGDCEAYATLNQIYDHLQYVDVFRAVVNKFPSSHLFLPYVVTTTNDIVNITDKQYIAHCRQLRGVFRTEVFARDLTSSDLPNAAFIAPHALSWCCDLYAMFLFLTSNDQRPQFLIDLRRTCRDEHRRASGNAVRVYIGTGEKARKRDRDALDNMRGLWEKRIKSEIET